DGIRDFHVTGVQTCALPISHCCCKVDVLYLVFKIHTVVLPYNPAPGSSSVFIRLGSFIEWFDNIKWNGSLHDWLQRLSCGNCTRSEERRVGKGGSGRGVAYR